MGSHAFEVEEPNNSTDCGLSAHVLALAELLCPFGSFMSWFWPHCVVGLWWNEGVGLPWVQTFMDACSGLDSGDLEVNLTLSLPSCLVRGVGWKDSAAHPALTPMICCVPPGPLLASLHTQQCPPVPTH